MNDVDEDEDDDEKDEDGDEKDVDADTVTLFFDTPTTIPTTAPEMTKMIRKSNKQNLQFAFANPSLH